MREWDRAAATAPLRCAEHVVEVTLCQLDRQVPAFLRQQRGEVRVRVAGPVGENDVEVACGCLGDRAAVAERFGEGPFCGAERVELQDQPLRLDRCCFSGCQPIVERANGDLDQIELGRHSV